MKRKGYLLPVVLTVICALVFTSKIAIAQETRQQIAKRAFPSVILLVMEDANGQPVSLGSGFFVADGVVATNLHVIEEAVSGYAKIVGQQVKHNVEGTVTIDDKRDLVLLSVPSAKAPSLSLGDIGDSGEATVGDEVYVVGNPYGLEGTFSQGIISGVRKIDSDSLLQITAPISPGSSGGPVLNSRGEVIGVAVATFKGGQNLNFAIPASYLSALLSNMKPVTPLAGGTQPGRGESILDGLGERSTEGVIGTLFKWGYLGSYSFSLRNKLRQPVKDVYCLVIFYTHDGEPIDFAVVEHKELIPAGLAKRYSSGLIFAVDDSVQELVGTSSRSIEIRVLDFKIVE